MSTVRKDAIGQEIKIGDIVMPFMKSSHNLDMSIVTRFNPKMVQLNGGQTNIESERMVVVTENLRLLGKQSVIDSLQQQYESKMVYETKEVKVPIRYLVVGDPRSATPRAWIIRFEGDTLEAARAAFGKFRHENPGSNITHMIYKTHDGKHVWERNGYYISKRSLLAWRSLPDSVVAYASGGDGICEIPNGNSVTELKIV